MGTFHGVEVDSGDEAAVGRKEFRRGGMISETKDDKESPVQTEVSRMSLKIDSLHRLISDFEQVIGRYLVPEQDTFDDVNKLAAEGRPLVSSHTETLRSLNADLNSAFSRLSSLMERVES